MKCRCSNCGWFEVNPGGAMFCGYSDERTWENESCLAWKDKNEPQTNYDLIVSKTLEELAEWIADILNHCDNQAVFSKCTPSCPLYQCCNEMDNIEDWLKQETNKED